jgi:hypothetical protein
VLLYVNNGAGSNCSDTGTGTLSQPYCTIAAAVAAVQPGQTISVTGIYAEHVTIDKSGAAGQPITLQRQQSAVTLTGANAGITIDGQHDVTVAGFAIRPTQSVPGVVINNSSQITVQQVTVAPATGGDIPGFRLTAVTDSLLQQIRTVSGPTTTGISLDAATSQVTIKSAVATPFGTSGTRPIDVYGHDNVIIDSVALDGNPAGITIEPGATNNTVANNDVEYGFSYGILNSSANGTAFANNRVTRNCQAGVRIDGTSSGVSVENNLVVLNLSVSNNCSASITNSVEIGVYDAAVGNTVVDYNTVYDGVAQSPSLYAWNTAMGLDAFRSASGQAAHDIETDNWNAADLDSANSAAPGYQNTDRLGHPREDDPAAPNTGAGPITYADRGDIETLVPPTPQLNVTADQKTFSVTADASASTPGPFPIATYTFSFGDGSTVTQATPIATHTYATPGTYLVGLVVTDTIGVASNEVTSSQAFPLYPVLRTVALLSRSDDHYVTAESAGALPLIANRTAIGPWELFDIIDLRNGLVALRSHANGLFVSVQLPSSTQLKATDTSPVDSGSFELITNADGSVSLLCHANGSYVTAEDAGAQPLNANRSAIGPWEQFYLADATNAAVGFQAVVNSNFVTAEDAGAQPLIANRTAMGSWETFDLVDAGDGWVALYSHADSRFVTAEDAGAQPLIANRTAIGPWEKFKITTNADGRTINLLSYITGRYVTAEDAGAQSLIANRTAVNLWEEFILYKAG